MERNQGKELINLEQYMSLLNEEPYGYSLINHLGCVTNPGIQGIGVRVRADKFRIMPPGEFNPLIYRGQHKDYPKLLPSACRPKEPLQSFLAWARATEFTDLFCDTPYYSKLTDYKDPFFGCEFDFDLTAIAQHYEFETTYLDFTKDVAVATFFAYTKRLGNGQYVPIVDFEADGGYSPTLYIGNIKQIYKVMPTDFRVVGFQAALRPLLQQAICIDAKSEFGVDKAHFQKIALPQSKEMAIGIYEHFKQGALLFPSIQKDKLYYICEEVQKMHGQAVFSGYIQQYCEMYSDFSKAQLEQELLNHGYSIENTRIRLDTKYLARMQCEFEQYILPWLDNCVGYRGTAPSM